MKLLSLAPSYVRWHYGTALKNIVIISENIIWFLWHFFSISVLARTLFVPWQRLHEERPRGFDLTAFFETAVINTIMRGVGFTVRSLMILIGFACIVAVMACAVLFFAAWLLMPVLILFTIILGFILIVKPA